MSKGAASILVLVSGGVLVSLALLSGDSLASGSAYKKIWAAGLLTLGLGVAADLVPEIVGPFAVLIIIASVVKNPGKIGAFVTGKPAASASVDPAVNPAAAGPPAPVGRKVVA